MESFHESLGIEKCLLSWPKGRMDAFNVTRTLFVSRRRFPIECNALDV